MEIRWIRDKSKYANGWYGYVGHWKIFYLYWDAGAPPKNDDGETLHWRLTCNLPGMKSVLGNYLKESEGMQRGLNVLQYWIGKLEETKDGK